MSCLRPAAFACALLLLTGPAMAAPKDKLVPNQKAPPIVRGAAVVTTSAPNARLAAVITADGTLLRNKGVAFVEHTSVGSYCVVPKPTAGINLGSFVASVNADFSLNVGDVHFAEYGISPCFTAAGTGSKQGILVITHKPDNGFARADLAFSIFVP